MRKYPKFQTHQLNVRWRWSSESKAEDSILWWKGLSRQLVHDEVDKSFNYEELCDRRALWATVDCYDRMMFATGCDGPKRVGIPPMPRWVMEDEYVDMLKQGMLMVEITKIINAKERLEDETRGV